MQKRIFTFLFFLFFISNLLTAQDKNYYKITAPGFWKSLTAIGEQIKKDGSKQYEFGEWQIFFPKAYINFVKKFPKNGGTFEYYVKVDEGGAYDAQIRFKDGPGKSSEAYDDPSGTEKKLLVQEINEVVSKVITAFGSTASIN